jgi:Arc/MetJ-type ribon-helix-helix transcriptional regulator
MRKRTTRPVRLNLEISPDLSKKLIALTAKTKGASKSETIRRAINLLGEVIQAQEDGRELLIRDKQGKETIIKFI